MIAFLSRKMLALLVVVGLSASIASAAPPAPPPAPPTVWDPDTSPFIPPPPDWPFKPTQKGFDPFLPPGFGPAAKPQFDFSKYPEERKKLTGSKGFTKLGVVYEVLAPSTGHPDFDVIPFGMTTYNCIAWTVGVTDRWVWPGETLPAFDTLYAKYGFKRLKSRDTTVEAGVEKVVLYGNLTDDGRVKATHGAKQEADGTWSSKLGGLSLIKHPTVEAVGGGTYGDPIAVYARKKAGVKP